MQEVHDTMDLEMQWLPSPQMDGSSAVEIMNTAIHTAKSMKLSMTGTNHQSPSISRASSYKSVNSSSDGSFSDLISMVDSGKCIHHNIQSFLQLVLITTISSMLTSFSETVLFGDVSLTTLQFVWLKLTLDVFGGLALLTKPSEDTRASLLPVSCRKSLITCTRDAILISNL